MNTLTNTPAQENAVPMVRRKRTRHGWSEASNPLDMLVRRGAWITACVVLLVAIWLVAKNAGWI